MGDPAMTLTHATLPAKGQARGTVVLLHGLGADEEDLLGLALDLPRDLHYLSVRAPLAVPWGGYAWYPMSALPSAVPTAVDAAEAAAFTASLGALCTWLAALPAAAGLAPERTLLVGFSQGAAMTAAVLCRPGAPVLAGYALLSGYLHPAAPAPADLTGRSVFIGHGTQDLVVDAALARQAMARLSAAGARVLHREYTAAHAVCAEEVADLRQWIDATLGPETRDVKPQDPG